MIELIAIIAGIAVLILTPIEVNKIKNGWMRKNFKGSQADFLVAYRKQLMILTVVGAIFGAFNIFLGVVEETPGENYVKYFAAALWFAVSGMSYWGRTQLASVAPASVPPPANNP